MIKNRKMGHVGMPTDDYRATVRFFVDELGFELIGDFMNGDTPMGFLANDDVVYEVWEEKDMDPALRGKLDHYCFDSSDVEADYAYCREKGYAFATDGIQELPTLWENGCRYFMIYAPTGQKVEFCQVL